MKNFLKYTVAAVILAFSTFTSAAIFHVGDYKVTASTLINTTDAGRTDTYGVGRIDSISTLTGAAYWSAGQNGEYLNFNFSDYVLTGAISPAGVFEASGGRVDFWLNSSDLFTNMLDYTTQKTAQETGELYLQAAASGTTRGVDFGPSYTAVGFLDMVGGSYGASLDTSLLTDFLGDATDMSFNMTATQLQDRTNFDFLGSSDSQGVATVPAPAPLFLMGTGLLGLGLVKRKQA